MKRLFTFLAKQARRKIAKLYRNMSSDEGVQSSLNRSRAQWGEEPIILQFKRNERSDNFSSSKSI